MSDQGSPDRRESHPSRLETVSRTVLAAGVVVASIWWLATILHENDPSDVSAQAIRKLRSREPDERAAGARILSSVGSGRSRVAIPPLVASLGDEAAEVRIASARAIGSLASGSVRARADTEDVRRACSALLKASDDEQPGVRTAIADAWSAIFAAGSIRYPSGQADEPIPVDLGALGAMLKSQLVVPVDAEVVVAALGRTAGDRDVGPRLSALYALAKVAGWTTLAPPPAVLDGLRDESPDVRAAAASAVGYFRTGIDTAIPVLLRSLDRDEPIVRKASATALDFARPSAAVVPLLVDALAHRNREVRFRATRVLGRIGPGAGAAIHPLVLILGEAIDSGEVAEKAAAVHVYEFAESTYRYGDNIRFWDAGCEAAWSLGRIAPNTSSAGAVVAALKGALHSEHRSRRVTAAVALFRFGPSASATVDDLISALARVALDDADIDDGVAFVRALSRVAPGTSASGKAIESISRALRSGSAWTRATAAESLGQFGPSASSVISELRTLEKDPDPKVRAAVTSTLSAIHPKHLPRP